MADDEIEGIILDVGSGMLKGGFTGRDAPNMVIPNIVGRPKYPGIMVGMGQKDAYVGDEAQSMRGMLVLKYPVVHGIVQDWDDMEKVLLSKPINKVRPNVCCCSCCCCCCCCFWQLYHHSYYNELRCAPEQHPTIISQPVFTPRPQSEKHCQILFETFEVPALYVNIPASYTIYATGRRTACIVDMGDGMAQVVPIYGSELDLHRSPPPF